MRDPKRIRKFCERLAAAWEMYPEFRFGQFMVNCLGAMKRDPFFPEDDEMIEHIEQCAPYFRLWYYHPWAVPAYEIDGVYFSVPRG